MQPEWNALNQRSCEKILLLLKEKEKQTNKQKKNRSRLIPCIEDDKECSVFITNICLHGKMLILPYLWESLQKHMGFTSNVSKALQFTFFNIYLPNQKTITCLSHSLVWLPPKYLRLLAGDYNGQSVVEVIFYSLARKTVRLPYSLQRRRSKLPFSSHLCLNVVPNWKIQLEMDLEIKLNLVWLGHNFSFIAFTFPLFWIVDSPTNWPSTFYLRTKLLVDVKWAALGRSVWILKQDLVPRGSGQH